MKHKFTSPLPDMISLSNFDVKWCLNRPFSLACEHVHEVEASIDFIYEKLI